MSLRDRIGRRAVPRLIVALSRIRLPRRVEAAVRRATGRRGRVDLFIAYDDPLSAVAVLGLAERLAVRPVDLIVHPVVARGIEDDPAVDRKRAYAVVDAGRLLARDGVTLSRRASLEPGEVAFLAAWTMQIADPADRAAFAADAMRALWCGSEGPVDRGALATAWAARATHAGPPVDDPAATAGGERRMRRRGLYDTPIAVVHGQWFFAHERLPAIEHRLDELGWTAR